MSDNVVQLGDYRPHVTGMARCLACKHEWAAVAPIGTVELECPECSTFKGLFKGTSSTEFPQFQCNCGEMTFYVDWYGPYCCHCGSRPHNHDGTRAS
jgi:hypothetical protein